MKRLILAFWGLLASCGSGEAPKPPAAPPGMPPAAASGERAKDPICHMMVEKATALKHVHEGTAYYFCAQGCVQKFKADPKKHALACACGKVSKKCPCEHCGGHLGGCDCGK
jgi:YHS domain-containing protein